VVDFNTIPKRRGDIFPPFLKSLYQI